MSAHSDGFQPGCRHFLRHLSHFFMKKIALVTGSAGLIGSESCQRFHAEGFDVVGLDNDMRAYFFGTGASTRDQKNKLEQTLARYTHHGVDIRDAAAVLEVF